MISTKEKILLATALFWQKKYENMCPDVGMGPTLEFMLDGISKEVGIMLTVRERNEVLMEYCNRFQKTV